MKNIFKERKIHIACVCLLLVMLLAGCSNLETDNQETDLFDVLNRADSVKIGNHIVVYNSESGNIYYGEMVNDKPKIIKNIKEKRKKPKSSVLPLIIILSRY